MYKMMDLFAGAGGLSNGFEQTEQFEAIIAVENNTHALKTYKDNHDKIKEIYTDISKVTYRNEKGELKQEFQEVDVIIGGPPCQGFSNANRQKNTLISSNNQLVKEYLRAVEEIEPKAFVLENVPTMDSEKHKFFVSKSDLKELRKLDMETKDEEIVIGETTRFSEYLLSFFSQNSNDISKLESISISTKVYSKLNTLLKKLVRGEVDSINYINKSNNRKVLFKLINYWDECHKDYLNSNYINSWHNLKSCLGDFLENRKCIDELRDNLISIIETQKVIFKLKEIIKQDILYQKIYIGRDGIVVELQSYNVFNYVVSKLSSFGYELNSNNKLFNSADFGVPQLRRRLILIGVKRKYLSTDTVQIPKPIKKMKEYNTIYNAIADLENLEPTVNIIEDTLTKNRPPIKDDPLNIYLNSATGILYNHVKTKSTDIAKKRFKALTQGDNFHDLDDNLKSSYSDHTRTQNTVYKRLVYNSPSDTVINVRKSMWVHPTKHRALSIREAARLQSFQDDYRFFGHKDAQYQQIGNAVPPILARAIAESLLISFGDKVIKPLKKCIT